MDSQLKKAILLSVAFLAIFLVPKFFFVKKDTKFTTEYFSKVDRVGYEDEPAYWSVGISPSLALEKTKETKGYTVSTVISYVFLIAAIAIIILTALDIAFVKSAPNWLIFVCFAGYLGFQYGTYQGISTNNYVKLSESEFTRITGVSDKSVKFVEDNKDGELAKLFDKELIK